jgi:citrate synthase
MDRMLRSDEAARRLGVKVTTLYAYVSRGLLASHPEPGGRHSLFSVDDVERLARRSRHGKTVETRMATITTAITQLTDRGPLYRGVPAADLATTASYEEVAGLLWAVPDGTDAGACWETPAIGPAPALAAGDRLRWAVVMAGGTDPLRSDLRPRAVVRVARRIVVSMVAALDPPAAASTGAAPPPLALDGGRIIEDSIAGRMAARLSPSPSEELVRASNAALVLLADHELATSTVAARVAASVRADTYDVVLAGLGTLGGRLHGGASRVVHTLLTEAAAVGVEQAVADALRVHGLLPGFGHPVYESGDARFGVLDGLFCALATAEERALVHSLVDIAAGADLPPPNVDLGLAAVVWAAGLPSDAGQTIFTVARVAGWVAHLLEELDEPPLRYRARAVYSTLGQV